LAGSCDESRSNDHSDRSGFRGRPGWILVGPLGARSQFEPFVIHSTSVAVSREHRRAKTDRLDTEMLIRVFLGWLRGEPRHCKMVAIPTLEEEDARRPSRERQNLIGERTRIINRMKAALIRLGIRGFKPELLKAPQRLAATGRPRILYCEHAFHGLTNGALSLNGDEIFREGFEPLLPHCIRIPFNDLVELEKALHSRTIAAFIVEPIQGKGVNVPDDDYLKLAADLCRRHGTLFVADEVQTGLGRTGRFLAVEYWNVEPDMVLLAKTLSGGHVPVGALLTRKWIFDKVFDRMERAVAHGSTFGTNDLAMAAGIATLDVLKSEQLVEKAAQTGERLLRAFTEMTQRYEFLREVRGKGLMIGIEFGPPRSLKLKASWHALEAARTGLFSQLITIPLFKEHKLLSQVSSHAGHTIKLLPALVISDSDCDWILSSFDSVIAESHRVPGAIWSLGKNLAGHAMQSKK
jgi:ornithine--oxo-acid transaminase